MKEKNTCEETKHETTPTCLEEVSHWRDVLKDNLSNDKALWKLRCYLNWCMKQNDANARVRFKECCKSREKEIEKRLDSEGWMKLSKQEVIRKADKFINE